MAEALPLGVDVIATDFGGNTDFCIGPLAHPLHYREVPIPRGSYPHADGHTWAEPYLDHAAQLCRNVAFRRLAIADNPKSLDPSCNALVLSEYRKRFSFADVGASYRDRLVALWADRNFFVNGINICEQ